LGYGPVVIGGKGQKKRRGVRDWAGTGDTGQNKEANKEKTKNVGGRVEEL